MPPETVDLSQYDDELIEAAFWLQEHIRREGIEAVPFMDRAEVYARQDGPEQVAEDISHQLRWLL